MQPPTHEVTVRVLVVYVVTISHVEPCFFVVVMGQTVVVVYDVIVSVLLEIGHELVTDALELLVTLECGGQL